MNLISINENNLVYVERKKHIKEQNLVSTMHMSHQYFYNNTHSQHTMKKM